MFLSDFDFPLPEARIAQSPVEPRDHSRLLVLDRQKPGLEHRRFFDLPSYLRPGDLLVANDARVIPARLLGKKADTGGKAELLLCERLPSDDQPGERWVALGQASKGLKPGARLVFGDLEVQVIAPQGDGAYEVRLLTEDVPAALAKAGALPLPPYIRRVPGADDQTRYQTVYAQRPVAAAAPTAGLHFTPRLLEELAGKGVRFATLTLHVGPGTFLPVRVEDLSQHRMHEEVYEIPEATAAAVAETRRAGGRVVAVGTTSVRALEASAAQHGTLTSGLHRASLFITPGFQFQVIDALVTNFHLPKSTLVMMVSALVGRERLLATYAEAVKNEYRFFSYGDAMLIL
jgi:S-adenosylmethionine:tRNA ribosyltransferase-isomerase